MVINRRIMTAVFAALTASGAMVLISTPARANVDAGCSNEACFNNECKPYTGASCNQPAGHPYDCASDPCHPTVY